MSERFKFFGFLYLQCCAMRNIVKTKDDECDAKLERLIDRLQDGPYKDIKNIQIFAKKCREARYQMSSLFAKRRLASLLQQIEPYLNKKYSQQLEAYLERLIKSHGNRQPNITHDLNALRYINKKSLTLKEKLAFLKVMTIEHKYENAGLELKQLPVHHHKQEIETGFINKQYQQLMDMYQHSTALFMSKSDRLKSLELNQEDPELVMLMNLAQP